MLSVLNLEVTPDCDCNKHAQKMDNKGIEWCKEHIDDIVGWLKEESKARKLPFIKFVAKKVVKMAIARAEKNPRGPKDVPKVEEEPEDIKVKSKSVKKKKPKKCACSK
jgi:hypothetical protein